MKKLNCNLYGLSELTESEKMDTEGGAFPIRVLVTGTGWALGLMFKLFISYPAHVIGGGVLGIL